MARRPVEDNSRVQLQARVSEEADHVKLSGRDSLRVLDLLEGPPEPNAKLLAAARALPRRSLLIMGVMARRASS
jgi:uncharacterized protein (DUF1778 family)